MNRGGIFNLLSVGFTLYDPSEIVYDESTTYFARWNGEYPKVVPSGSTLASTGGIEDSAWQLVSANSVIDYLNTGKASISLGGDLTLAKLANEVIDVRMLGVVGDGTDESKKMQQAISISGRISIPNGMNVRVTEFNIPASGEIHLGKGAKLTSLTKDAISFRKANRYTVTGKPRKGATSITLSEAPTGATTRLLLSRSVDASDPWYIENARNPDELGYQGEVLHVRSIEGNRVDLWSPLPLDVDTGSISFIPNDDIHIFGGTLVNEATGSTYMYDSLGSHGIYLHNTIIDCKGNGGIRHGASYGIHLSKIAVINRVGNGSVFFGYGCCDCSVTNSSFLGGVRGDAQLIFFSGCRRMISDGNKYFIEVDSTPSAGLYFGAKTIGCTSTSDMFTGGKYGIYGAFGAQQFSIVEPKSSGQRSACIFLQDCQYFNIEEPSLSINTERSYTNGAIVLRSCDQYSIKCSKRIQADKCFVLSTYNPANDQFKASTGATICLIGVGDININTPMTKATIKVDLDGNFSSYYAGGSFTGKFTGNKITGKTVLHAALSVDIRDNHFGSDGVVDPLVLSGAALYNKVRDNTFKGTGFATTIPSTSRGTALNAIYPTNNISGTGLTISSTEIGGTKPAIGNIGSLQVPTNFFLPTNSWISTGSTHSIAGFRYNGKRTGTAEDWYAVTINEE